MAENPHLYGLNWKILQCYKVIISELGHSNAGFFMLAVNAYFDDIGQLEAQYILVAMNELHAIFKEQAEQQQFNEKIKQDALAKVAKIRGR